ncbi:VC0807 family protein [Actinocrispum sp. NPDC049592]|uniref:VC0807 family protein n=1 Tax=Actinocrispum sp. NPDC049592 TaxID=3154835 RepID=UPI0034376723
MRKLVPSIAFNAIVPFVVYLLVRSHVDSEATALAIAAGIPVLFTAAIFIWRKRIDPIGAVAVVAYAIVLALSILSGGSPLLLKLNDAVLTGPFGLICLASLVVGKPLHLVVHEFVARRKGTEVSPFVHKAAPVITGIVGTMLTVHALAMLFMAILLPTETFLALSRVVGIAIIAAGVGALFWYRRRVSLPATRS